MRDEGGGDEGTVLLQPILGVIGHLISQANWTLADLLFEDDVFAQPRQEFVEGELASVVERKQEILRPLGGGCELCAVDREKRIGGGKGSALIAVEERVVLGQALPKGRDFFDEIGIVAGLRPEEGGFKQTRIAKAVTATITLDLVDMHGQNLGHGEVVRHSASFL
jgi:hypothetical protein